MIFNAYLKFEEAMLDHEDEDSDDDEDDEDEGSDSAENLVDQVDMLLNFTYRDIDQEEDEEEPAEKLKLTKEEK